MGTGKPKALRLSNADKADIALIRESYQLDDDSSAIRMAIRKVARRIRARKAAKNDRS